MGTVMVMFKMQSLILHILGVSIQLMIVSMFLIKETTQFAELLHKVCISKEICSKNHIGAGEVITFAAKSGDGQLNCPMGIAIYLKENCLFVCSRYQHTIKKITSSGIKIQEKKKINNFNSRNNQCFCREWNPRQC